MSAQLLSVLKCSVHFDTSGLTRSQQQTSAMLFNILQCSWHLDMSGLTRSQQQTSAMYSFQSIKAWKYQNIEPKRLHHFSVLIRFPLNTGLYVCLHIQTNSTVFALYIYSANREWSDVCTACEHDSITKPSKFLVSCTIFLQHYVGGLLLFFMVIWNQKSIT